MKKNIFQSYRNSSFYTNFNPKKWKGILDIAYSSVVEGNARAHNIMLSDPKVFEDATLYSTALNKAIIQEFKEQVGINPIWKKRIRRFKSNRMIYYIVDRNFFICFKALGEENTIEGTNSNRFNNTIKGVDFSLNQEVLKELSKLGVKGIPPLLFVTFKRGGESILEIRFQHYVEGFPVIDFTLNEISTSKTKQKQSNNNFDGGLVLNIV